MKRMGAEVRLVGDTFDEANVRISKLAAIPLADDCSWRLPACPQCSNAPQNALTAARKPTNHINRHPQSYAKELARTEGRVFVPPFDDPDVIAGQGTVGMEILRQMASDKELHAIFVPARAENTLTILAAFAATAFANQFLWMLRQHLKTVPDASDSPRPPTHPSPPHRSGAGV